MVPTLEYAEHLDYASMVRAVTAAESPSGLKSEYAKGKALRFLLTHGLTLYIGNHEHHDMARAVHLYDESYLEGYFMKDRKTSQMQLEWRDFDGMLKILEMDYPGLIDQLKLLLESKIKQTLRIK